MSIPYEEMTDNFFNEEELKIVDNHIRKYPHKMAATLPVLWMMQDKYNWISTNAMKYVANLLDVPDDHVYGVVTFYTMYNKKPMGKVHLQICTNVSCMLNGAYDIYNYISDKLKIKNKQTTEDGMFTIEEVECLGSCGTAPMLQVNNREFYENLEMQKIDSLLDELKSKHA